MSIGNVTMRGAGLAVVVAGTALLASCADYGRHGLAQPGRYAAWTCDGIDAERGRVETAANNLFRSARRKGAFGTRGDAEILENWPTLIFTRDRGPRDRQRYEQLSISYEQLRIAARQRGCVLAFASDVSATVRAGG